jgi:hypothetical protein
MSIDFTKWSVAEMREELVRLTGDDIAAVEAIKGKSILAERIIEARQQLGLDRDEPVARFGEAEVERKSMLVPSRSRKVDTDEEQSDEQPVKEPAMGSPEWQDFVLSHLTNDEFSTKGDKKFPRANGLRRVVQLLCGPIVECGPSQIIYPSPTTCAVVYNVNIMWTRGLNVPQWLGEDEIEKLNIPVRKFSDVADCSRDNTPHPYNLHAPATASTKAAGRVFKNILQLTCHTAEEMSLAVEEEVKVTEMSVANSDNEPAVTVQKITINNLASRLGIDVEKALQFHSLKSNVNLLSRTEAAAFIVILNKYQTDTEGSMAIPDFIKSAL